MTSYYNTRQIYKLVFSVKWTTVLKFVFRQTALKMKQDKQKKVLKRRKHFGELHVLVWKNIQAWSHTQVTAPAGILL